MGRNSVTRRQFIHFGAGAVAAGAAAKVTLLNPTHLSAFCRAAAAQRHSPFRLDWNRRSGLRVTLGDAHGPRRSVRGSLRPL